MSRVLHNGIQILPPVGDERAEIPAFNAIQCVNADHRRKHPAYAVLAASLAQQAFNFDALMEETA